MGCVLIDDQDHINFGKTNDFNEKYWSVLCFSVSSHPFTLKRLSNRCVFKP